MKKYPRLKEETENILNENLKELKDKIINDIDKKLAEDHYYNEVYTIESNLDF